MQGTPSSFSSQSGCPFTFPPAVHENSGSSTSSPTLSVFSLLHFGHSGIENKYAVKRVQAEELVTVGMM
ncbi:hypothetical protein CR201_G0031824 [Pongo abelii]|uniref:Uncharacterized protein n=1 Tax=Pongo abelii TaxID=9601 RepID=A0A2J8TW71_PONAB|nr:hypothetical protein CR201_G0031824 [Pongo abelii]